MTGRELCGEDTVKFGIATHFMSMTEYETLIYTVKSLV
jgi:phenylpropionate dioxygenase-like ring-hydroxylating dioxygenase large terminal subunit